MVWKLIGSCISPRTCQACKRNKGEDGPYARYGDTEELALALDRRLSFINDDKRGTSVVELLKREGSTLGIIVSGGIDKGCRPKIANLRPGSIAHRSDALAVGDYIVSVNGIRTTKLKHEEIVNLLKNAGEKVTLEVEYEIPSSSAENTVCMCPKAIQVKLDKENGSFGFTVRGGATDDRLKSRPLVITHVRHAGPADREGTIKPGDRLLAVDGINLTTATLQEALSVLKQVDKEALLTIEYDVSIMDAVCNASGPLLVEIDKTPGCNLGISLARIHRPENIMVIESIKQASIAERCGALHVGDHVLSIDGTQVDHVSVAEATQLLKTSVGDVIKIEILPVSQMAIRTSIRKGLSSPASFSPNVPSKFYTISSIGGRSALADSNLHYFSPHFSPRLSQGKWNNHTNKRSLHMLPPCSSNVSLSSVATHPTLSCGQVCHTEITEVTIHADHRGFGFAIQGSNFPLADAFYTPPVISNIDPGGQAEKTGILQIGDRILAVDGQSTEGLRADEVTHLIEQSRPRVTLEIEFDVAESVVPSSGTFTVKLAKRGSGLGITITSPKHRRPGDPLIISAIKKGSVAHRTGTIQPGDKLLSIDSVRMDNCTVEDAAQILMACDEIVKLRIRKDDTFSEEPDITGSVVYTVELVRHGGPLGITISGTEEPFDPIMISGLTEGGLAERTGALHDGDCLLAINGQSLRGKPLSEAILLLQNSADIVTLKISRSMDLAQNSDTESIRSPKAQEPEDQGYFGTFVAPQLPSVDSAVESWDSTGLDTSMNGTRRKHNNAGPSNEQVSNITGEPSCTQELQLNSDNIKLAQEGQTKLESEWEDVWTLKTQSNNNSFATSSQLEHSEDGKADWNKVLEDLETCGESQLLREIERSIMGSDQALAANGSQGTNSSRSLQNNTNSYQRMSRAMSEENLHDMAGRAGPSHIGKNDLQNSKCNTLPHPPKSMHSPLSDCSPTSTYQTYQGSYSLPVPIEVHRVTLFKDRVYEDFGFSVSDGLYERGVYVNRIRPGGPADMTGILRPFDRILQVNETKTNDFDCCLTVPLIAAAGDKIELIVSRPAFISPVSPGGSTIGRGSIFHPWVDEGDREDCSSPAPPNSTSQRVLTKTL